MTVLNSTKKVIALGNDVATVFSFNPMVLPRQSSELEVTLVTAAGVETVLVEGTGATNYSVSVSAYPGTGSITYPADAVTPLATGDEIVMRRVLVADQQTGLSVQGGYNPATQETALDKLTMLVLQLQEQLDRALKGPVNDPGTIDYALPSVPAAGEYLKVNAAGDGFESAAITTTSATASASVATDSLTTGTAGVAATFSRGDHAHPLPTITVAKGGTGATTAATARTALGLGTAAVLDTGTTAGKVVVLDGSAKLPAVDGSALTGLAGGFTMASGIMAPYAGRPASPPSGWLTCDGSSQLRASFASLVAILLPSIGTATITIATPGVVTKAAHGLVAGDRVYFTTTGALPTGLAIETQYFVLSTGLATDTFRLALTDGGAAINTTGSQSGTHTLRSCSFGIADATHFNLPATAGRALVGSGTSTASDATAHPPGQLAGTETHTLTTPQIPSHSHTAAQSGVGATVASGADTQIDSTGNTGSTGGGGSHPNMQPYLAIGCWIIKT